ncbi:MAG: metallophosphoesterase [Candidatus Gracilibacteria bacterium]
MIKSRTIFIGDVQGCYSELKLLIKKLKLIPKDKVYFAGDMINKGPKSFKVLKYIYKNKGQFKCVKGNHEIDFLEWLEGKPYKKNKAFKKLRNKIAKKGVPYLIQYLKDLPLYIEGNNFILLHGGLIPNKEIQDHSQDEITRLCEYEGKPWYEYYKGDKKIIYGHWAKEGIQFREKTKGLDSGCVYGKSLTAYILETGDVIQQTALSVYINPYKAQKTLSDKIKDLFKFKKGN